MLSKKFPPTVVPEVCLIEEPAREFSLLRLRQLDQQMYKFATFSGMIHTMNVLKYYQVLLGPFLAGRNFDFSDPHNPKKRVMGVGKNARNNVSPTSIGTLPRFESELN